MELPIEKVTSSDVSKRFGFYYDEAMTHPIGIERNGATRVVMLPASEYERLARLDHIAVTPEELSDEAIRSLRTAQARPEAIALNELMG
ncbi:putative prevent-host-death protein [Sphingopyxis sp. LC81]|jgi:PHD/YefM family antitoxin component YafN of YafNO toxin-antitoxin module|uniref:type II toxin-antitoxin system Phd/YefM family antitoxin n=1 Tax=Sphingopyxis sp. LC81 TaxID=1502850 RepID=UPI000510185C|nr:type II toxin-antitoxin system Phd/YefM family antitoxin [Sphingopyxis sp. LC81]KGB52906.1 putative prevent-host-death protein [Sphingopyxis sp. LC81]